MIRVNMHRDSRGWFVRDGGQDIVRKMPWGTVKYPVQICGATTTRLMDLPRGLKRIQIRFTKNPPAGRKSYRIGHGRLVGSTAHIDTGASMVMGEALDKGMRYVSAVPR